MPNETTPTTPLKTAACPATWDLIEQLVQLESSKNRMHLEYMGKAMPADVYLRFQNLRDERIPALRSQLRVGLASAPDQPPAHFAHAYADQLMLRCLVPVEPAPQAAPAAVAVPDEREAFEKWAAGEGINIRTDGGSYRTVIAGASYEAWQARAALAATPALPATGHSSAGDLAEPTDAEIIALNDGERFFSMSESRFGKEVNPHTQYHTGEPGYLQFARAVLARWGSATQAQAEVQAEPVTNLTASAIATAVCQRVAELDDRSSPADWPEAMLVTAEELQAILIEEVASAFPAPQAQPADALDAAPAAPINSEALQVIKALREWVMAVPADVAAALPAMPGIDADWMDAVEAALATHSAPADGLMVDMTPPATSRDRWMYNQGRLAEVERICAAIKTEDDYCVDQGDYMLDSDDCIKVARGTWLRPTFDRAAMAAAQEGGNAAAGKDGAA